MGRKRKWRNKQNLLCLFCGEEFDMLGMEVKYYKQRGYRIPGLCPSCRIQRRLEEKKWLRRIQKYAV